jgi:hypothetical protein
MKWRYKLRGVWLGALKRVFRRVPTPDWQYYFDNYLDERLRVLALPEANTMRDRRWLVALVSWKNNQGVTLFEFLFWGVGQRWWWDRRTYSQSWMRFRTEDAHRALETLIEVQQAHDVEALLVETRRRHDFWDRAVNLDRPPDPRPYEERLAEAEREERARTHWARPLGAHVGWSPGEPPPL